MESAPDSVPTTDKPVEDGAEETVKTEAPKEDFSAHLPASNADEEARKRAARAKRFGVVDNDEDKKKTERAERFGVDDSSLVKGLDAALPEKRPSKRGREGGNAEVERGAKRQNPVVNKEAKVVFAKVEAVGRMALLEKRAGQMAQRGSPLF